MEIAVFQFPPDTAAMKVTLNAAVPMDRRGSVESIVRNHAAEADIEWLASPSVKMVLAIEPGSCTPPPLMEHLEQRIWITISASGH